MDYFRSLVPDWLGRRGGLLVGASGVVEVFVGALVLLPASRGALVWAAAGLFVVYLLPHLDALRSVHRGRPGVLWRPAGVVARLAVNVGYVGWAVTVALTAASAACAP
ncbi:hypothetical protein [Streptomyces luteolus]|uniref:DoxX family protein n=1 Tax=Streptomyces luteolus TaxID=3043615 RepID=A0ABT6T783_9ACTN|nr:hypothetical protein [Streptomyces sp. B-S-A12]MDI3423674.1 hypothetical protein [Streptomyces sp. B-S-A12]